MKKNKLILLTALIALCIVAGSVGMTTALAQSYTIEGTPDGQLKSVVIDEHFYSGTLEPNFTSNNVSVTTDKCGLYFDGTYSYGTAAVLSGYRLNSYNKINFSIDLLGTNDGFIYLAFGGADPTVRVQSYDFLLAINRNVVAMYEINGVDGWTQLGSASLDSIFKVGKMTDFSVTLEESSGKYKTKFEVFDNGVSKGSSTFGDVLINMDNPNGYMCFWAGQQEVFNLCNVEIYDSATHLAFSDDFVSSKLTYSDEAIGDSNWHINNNSLDSENVFISRVSCVDFNEPENVITAKTKFERCDEVSKPYEISFKARIISLENNSTFGLYLGADSVGDIDNSTVIGVSAYDGTNASLNVIKNGQIINDGENLIPLSSLNINDSAVYFDVIITSDNTVEVSLGNLKYTFEGIEYDGNWGFCNYSLDGFSKSVVKLDEVMVVKNTYTAYTASDLSNDFAGIKLTDDGFEDYYISNRTYYIGPGASIRPKSLFTEEPSLYFENAGSYSAFVPFNQYGEYILQFDAKIVSTSENGRSFGINFGKSAYASINSNSPSVTFECYKWESEFYTRMVTGLCSFDDGTNYKKVNGYNFYADQETKYNFMLVAKNRSIYVYYKEDSEDISKLGICRAVIPDVNTAGYVSIFGTNGISFDIFNYKLTNISAEATGDSEIALREAFDDNILSDKLVKSGSAEIKNNAMHLSNGSLSTKEDVGYYIANFTVSNQNADLTVDFADGKHAIFAKDLKTITVKDGEKEKVFDVSAYNLSSHDNVQVQLILQYDTLTIAAKAADEPNDRLGSPIAKYTFTSLVQKGKLSWTSNDCVIDGVSVYALDHTYQASNVNYEDDPDDASMWPKKEVLGSDDPVVAEPSSCAGSISSNIALFGVLGLAVAVKSLAKKRGENQ